MMINERQELFPLHIIFFSWAAAAMWVTTVWKYTPITLQTLEGSSVYTLKQVTS